MVRPLLKSPVNRNDIIDSISSNNQTSTRPMYVVYSHTACLLPKAADKVTFFKPVCESRLSQQTRFLFQNKLLTRNLHVIAVRIDRNVSFLS